MKSRFSALDLRAVVLELQEKLQGMRLQNVHDVLPVGRAFSFTFSRTDEKVTVVMESGSRIHSTAFVVEKPNAFPTGFTSKLRKHLKGRRLCSIEQVGFDRIVHMKFGFDDGNNALNLYLELFAKGNLILTDSEGRILCLLRSVELKGGKLAVGEKYALEQYGLLELNMLDKSLDFEFKTAIDLKSLARGPLAAFSPQMIDYCYRMIGGNKITSSAQMETLFSVASKLLLDISAGKSFCGILQTEREIPGREYLLEPKNPAYLSSFIPLKCLIPENDANFVEFESFNAAVDVYFSRLEAERATQRRANAELEAKRKLGAIEKEQQARIAGLEAAVESLLEKGQLVTEYAEDVEAALKVARTALESGMDWTEFGRLIESEKKSSNPRRAAVASLFAGLKLESNLVTLKLGPEGVLVDLIIDMSAHANARRLYELRNQARQKMERTVAALTEALRSAQEKIRVEVLQNLQKASSAAGHLQSVRKPFWFEKFTWFLSSDGILVVAARDAHQSELLIRKYLSPEDTFVFSDVEGSAVVLIKTHLHPLPPKTLIESGMFSISFSRAWEAKIVTSAWWTFAKNVSKYSDATKTEILPFGAFRIEGNKNFLPPTPLNLSFGFIFLLSDEERQEKMEQRKQKESNNDDLNLAVESISLTSSRSIDNNNNDDDNNNNNNNNNNVNINSNNSFIINTNVISDSKPEKKVVEIKKTKEELIEEIPKDSAKPPSDKQNVRGKHGKEKKMKKKYADQDEEERALRLELLGSVKKEPAKPQSKKEEQPKKGEQKMNNSRKTAAVPIKSSNTFDYQAEDSEDEENGSKDGNNDFIPSDYFTLTPDLSNGKSYPFAVAVCFPTSAVSSAAFRLKIVPGSLKKGKAAKSAVSHFVSACSDATLKDLIKAVPENELVKCLPSKVGLAGADGGQKKKNQPTKKRQKKPKN